MDATSHTYDKESHKNDKEKCMEKADDPLHLRNFVAQTSSHKSAVRGETPPLTKLHKACDSESCTRVSESQRLHLDDHPLLKTKKITEPDHEGML